jgi:hypothetical protein
LPARFSSTVEIITSGADFNAYASVKYQGDRRPHESLTKRGGRPESCE